MVFLIGLLVFTPIHLPCLRHRISLWHHLHPAVRQTHPLTITLIKQLQDNLWMRLVGSFWRCSPELTHFISSGVKSRPVMNIRSGMVRMRKKGSANEKGLCLTSQRMPKHTIWIRVKICICIVFTCKDKQTGWSY